MTTVVHFVRHGSHDLLGKELCGRRAGVPLGEAGRQEAAAVARRLAAERVEALYTSPMERAVETAQTIGEALHQAALPEEALNEVDFGAWNGVDFANLEGDPAWAAWNAEPLAPRPPGGESLVEVQARVGGWLARTVRDHPDGTVVAVSHADVIKSMLTLALGLPLDRRGRIEVSPGSVTTIVAGDWGVKVHCINEAPR